MTELNRLRILSKKILVLMAAFAMITAAPLLALSVSAADPHYRCIDHGEYCFTISPYTSASGHDFYVSPGTTLTITGKTTNTEINHVTFTFKNSVTHTKVTLKGTSSGSGMWVATLVGTDVVVGQTLNVKVAFTDRHHGTTVIGFPVNVKGDVFVTPEFPAGTIAAVGAPVGALGLFAIAKRNRMVQFLRIHK